MGKLIVNQELLERAAKYCSDETTKKEIENLLFCRWIQERDWESIRSGFDITTTLPIVK